MARLNEPAAAPTETIDSLKRKFMRQNRDIARANSTQSLRIRNLENETSRLLAENLGLRGQIVKLQGELENGKLQRMTQHTVIVKSQLETKLLEIGALLSSLGEVPTPQRKSRKSGNVNRENPASNPDRKNWRNVCSLSEAVADQEGRLPPILENKSYPRKTLEHQEILDLVAEGEPDTTDSPEIGPPPVSQFVDEDPVKIDLPKRGRKEEVEDTTGLDPVLSVNLEQRRKRKDSTVLSELKQASKPESTTNYGIREATGTLKTGAKRKLTIRDDEEQETSNRIRPGSPDNFNYTRVVNDTKSKSKAPISEKPSSRSTRDLATARGVPREKPSAAISNRKILAPKSVNDSPRKKSSVSDEAKLVKLNPLKPDGQKERSRDKRQENARIQPSSSNPVLDTIEIQPEPETPAAVEEFSPEPSQPPSTAKAESRDTPPPSDLEIGGESHRPSRRARGSVSYAEPSLRDKMRRPTKDLVDAVTREERARNAMKLEEQIALAPTIKAEPEADDAWISMPAASSATVENSPLRDKTSGPELLPSSITTHRKRRESILNQTELEIPKSTSAGAIAALLSETRRAKAAAREKDKERAMDNEAVVMKGLASLDIYEFRGSSPSSSEAQPMMIKGEKVPLRVSRRHSNLTRDYPQQSDSEASDMEATKRSEITVSRRRQSTLGLRASSSNVATKQVETDNALRRSVSTTGIVEAESGTSRSDRISARRRSMML
ncbi:uncharacterized protein RSE6_01162 [Rhynchosporium secalis]|uniref:Shugoshin n=1 Tax=Rhynchosporium secalis TaxID=38038 RepID=A0A1E1LYR9_RHYSE|nr:uncharacterized protein RSE6_01162 [Rhynchosporium secalis]